MVGVCCSHLSLNSIEAYIGAKIMTGDVDLTLHARTSSLMKEVVELVPYGASKVVTQENKEEYSPHDALVVQEIRTCFSSLIEGFEKYISISKHMKYLHSTSQLFWWPARHRYRRNT